MRFIATLFVFVAFSSCYTKENCGYYSGDLLREYLGNVLIRESDPRTGIIYNITDASSKTPYFGSYTFDSTGRLISYKFFGNDSAYTYNEELDNYGAVTFCEGTPLVYREIDDLSNDSIAVSLYFSSILRSYDSVTFAVNGESFRSILTKDTTFSNMLSIKRGFDVSNFDTINILINAAFQNTCNKKRQQLNDTLLLFRKNRLHFLIPKHQRRMLQANRR
jgi:hypothetical protein